MANVVASRVGGMRAWAISKAFSETSEKIAAVVRAEVERLHGFYLR